MCNQMWGIRCGQIIKGQCKLLWNKKSDTSIYTHNLYSQTLIFTNDRLYFTTDLSTFSCLNKNNDLLLLIVT